MKKVQLVLLRSVNEVGDEGDVIEVSRGYARNFLIPNGHAIANSKYAQDLIKSRHRAIGQARIQRRSQADARREHIEEEACHIHMRASDNGKLFGSVTAHAITEVLAKRGVHLNAKAVQVPHDRINTVGEYRIPIKLHDEVTATLLLHVEAQE